MTTMSIIVGLLASLYPQETFCSWAELEGSDNIDLSVLQFTETKCLLQQYLEKLMTKSINDKPKLEGARKSAYLRQVK